MNETRKKDKVFPALVSATIFLFGAGLAIVFRTHFQMVGFGILTALFGIGFGKLLWDSQKTKGEDENGG